MTATKALIATGLVVLAVLVYFAENIIGYYRFQKLCESEGGVRILHPLRKDVGWLAPEGTLGLAAMYGVGFTRFERGGMFFDRRYKGRGLPLQPSSYDERPANTSIQVIYELTNFNESVAGFTRTNISGYEVREIPSGRLMIRWTQVGYSKFDQDRTLFAAPSSEVCYYAGEFANRTNAERYFETR